MSKNTLYGIFDDEEVLLASVKEIRANNIEIKEVFSPFPIHGLDKALGLERNKNGYYSFHLWMFGLKFRSTHDL